MSDPTPFQPPRRRAPAVALADDPPEVLPAEEDDLVPEALPAPSALGRVLHFLGRVWYGITSACEWVFGALCLTVALAVLAAVPVVQFLSLGYLLEVCGRIGRTRRFRAGFIGVRKAARVGGIILGVYLVLLPLRLVSSMALSAQIIDPGSVIARRWRLGLALLTALAVVHIATACARGGRLRYFFWPFNVVWLVRRLLRGGYYAEARDRVWDFVASLRLLYYFWLGLRGFAGSMVWLVLPVSLIAAGRLIGQQGSQQAGGVGFLVGFAGFVQLLFVLLQLPFLQARFAAENRFKALFEWGDIVRGFARAPWAYAFALVVTLLSALPLYLLKIEMIPREATGFEGLRFGHLARLLLLDETLVVCLPELVFVMFIFPARLLTGWAYARSVKRPRYRHWFFTATAPLVTLPAAFFYVFVVFLSQYTSWNGIWSLYEQHAFLLPVPFVGR
jgi:Protein of unknown function (DUF4013)